MEMTPSELGHPLESPLEISRPGLHPTDQVFRMSAWKVPGIGQFSSFWVSVHAPWRKPQCRCTWVLWGAHQNQHTEKWCRLSVLICTMGTMVLLTPVGGPED